MKEGGSDRTGVERISHILGVRGDPNTCSNTIISTAATLHGNSTIGLGVPRRHPQLLRHQIKPKSAPKWIHVEDILST